VTQQPNYGQERLVVEVSKSLTHTHTHTNTHRDTQTQTHGRTPLNKWSARHRSRYLHNTHQTQQTNIRAFSGIRTRTSNNWCFYSPVVFMRDTMVNWKWIYFGSCRCWLSPTQQNLWTKGEAWLKDRERLLKFRNWSLAHVT